MIKLIKSSLFCLVSGLILLSIGGWGSFSAQADVIKNTSENLFIGMQVAVIFGAGLIVISGILFIIAIIKSQ